MDKGKIEGAYLLLKRFKNRLKTFDSALEKVHIQKADKKDFLALKVSLDKDRAASIFNDMKILFDTTVKQFDEKVVYERTQVEERYAKILRDQRLVMQTFEKKYNILVMKKIDKLEKIVNDLALDQARMPKDMEFMDGGLFPKKVTQIEESTERKIRDSYLDQKVENLK